MALTHVCVWDDKEGYRRTTIEEASEEYPYGVPARYGVFVCQLCAQNVCLTSKGSNARHFRHTSATQNRECEERSKVYDSLVLRSNSHPMPIRISVGDNYYNLSLGFMGMPLEDKEKWCEKITITGEGTQKFVYSSERIGTSGITYLSVGSDPSPEYHIQYDNPRAQAKFHWPEICSGVDPKGTLFDGSSGLMLNAGAKACPFHSYFLLQNQKIYNVPNGLRSEHVLELKNKSGTVWHLYQIEAMEFSKDVAYFFMKKSIFLKEKAGEFFPIWPPFAKTPYFIYHHSDEIYFLLSDMQSDLRRYPKKGSLESEGIDTGKVYRLAETSREQLVSVGQLGALGFQYIVNQELNLVAEAPEICLKDFDDVPIEPGICDSLPKRNILKVTAPFDGVVQVLRESKIQEIQALHSNEQLIIDQVKYGYEIAVFQNIDIVCSVKFVRPARKNIENSEADQLLFRKLQNARGHEVPVPHSLGCLFPYFKNMTLTRRWLYAHIRLGTCSDNALKILKEFVDGSGNNGGLC